MKLKYKCIDCKTIFHFKNIENHHRIYIPEKTSRLCIKCHKEITELNKKYCKNNNFKKISNKNRENLWNLFIILKNNSRELKNEELIKHNKWLKNYVKNN